MKKLLILALAVLTLGVSTLQASWFHDDSGESEKQRRLEVQEQLANQQQQTNQWEGVAFVLGLGCMLTLIVGTIIGSRARRHATRTQA